MGSSRLYSSACFDIVPPPTEIFHITTPSEPQLQNGTAKISMKIKREYYDAFGAAALIHFMVRKKEDEKEGKKSIQKKRKVVNDDDDDDLDNYQPLAAFSCQNPPKDDLTQWEKDGWVGAEFSIPLYRVGTVRVCAKYLGSVNFDDRFKFDFDFEYVCTIIFSNPLPPKKNPL